MPEATITPKVRELPPGEGIPPLIEELRPHTKELKQSVTLHLATCTVHSHSALGGHTAISEIDSSSRVFTVEREHSNGLLLVDETEYKTGLGRVAVTHQRRHEGMGVRAYGVTVEGVLEEMRPATRFEVAPGRYVAFVQATTSRLGSMIGTEERGRYRLKKEHLGLLTDSEAGEAGREISQMLAKETGAAVVVVINNNALRAKSQQPPRGS